jgi:hypothetical protein
MFGIPSKITIDNVKMSRHSNLLSWKKIYLIMELFWDIPKTIMHMEMVWLNLTIKINENNKEDLERQ